MVSLRAGRAKTSFAVAYLLPLAALVITSSQASAAAIMASRRATAALHGFLRLISKRCQASGARLPEVTGAIAPEAPLLRACLPRGRRSSQFPAAASPARTDSRCETSVVPREDDAETEASAQSQARSIPAITRSHWNGPPNHCAARTFLSDLSRRVGEMVTCPLALLRRPRGAGARCAWLTATTRPAPSRAWPALIPRESWLRKRKVRRKDSRERRASLRLLNRKFAHRPPATHSLWLARVRFVLSQ